MITRCNWATSSALMTHYHDTEWGVPLHDDKKLFEFLLLEGVQAGLSWSTVLNKRENYRQAYFDFDVQKIANFSSLDIERLMNNSGIIRNRLKIVASINNAQRFIEVQREFGTFDNYIWKFVEYTPIKNALVVQTDIPASTELSDIISKDLKQRGFKFVGSTIVYAHLQATGMVNDHLIGCFRYNQV